MSKIIGNFTFHKINKEKSITGKYTHRDLNVVLSHQATLDPTKEELEGEFIGDYKAVWDEESNEDSSKLIIRFKEGTDNQIYTLSWTGGNLNYTGEGFLDGENLIGWYVSVK